MTVENRKPKINIQKLGAWLSERTVTEECPFCKTSGWTAINGSDFLGCAMPYGNGEGDMYMTGVPMLALICRKCHFVRNIALSPSLLKAVLEEGADAVQ